MSSNSIFSNSSQNFLFELGTEELPPKALLSLIKALENNIKQGLEQAFIHFESLHSFATPRRLAIYISQLAEKSQDQKFSKRGPAVSSGLDQDGNPSKALLGFLQANQTSLESLSREQTDKGEYFLYEGLKAGQSIKNLMPKIIQDSLNQLPIPKLMRWGSSDMNFVRPVHWMVMLYGEEILEGHCLGLDANRISYGHRFHHPESISISSPDTYVLDLFKAQVIVNYSDRQEKIKNQIDQLARELKAHPVLPQNLLDEITSLVEWPEALVCKFDPNFLSTPPEALISALQQHQKCVALKDSQGTLLNYFIAVANLNSQNPKTIISGNEKVVRARLSDASFFYQTDLKINLDQHQEALSRLTYQAKLGSMLDRQTRLSHLAKTIAEKLNASQLLAARAGELSKADLVSQMVMEFPELQGIMGNYYAQAMGENLEICTALQEQYLPRFSGDRLPSTPTGIALSLAEKLDSLTGIFGIGEKPSGSKDPFALRRQAIGLIKILLEKSLNLELSEIIQISINLYGDLLSNINTYQEVEEFILERLKNYFIELNINPNIFEAVKHSNPKTLKDFEARISAVINFSKLPEAESLITANKRVKNLISKANYPIGDINLDLLTNSAEKDLYLALNQAKKLADLKLQDQDYSAYLQILSHLKNPIDLFFDQTLVLCEDLILQKNRLALLNQVYLAFSVIAEISGLTTCS